MAKIDACIALGKTVGGQLPGFMGRILNATIAAGIEDTHVAESVDEIVEQLRRGVRVLLTPRIDRLPAEDWPLIAQAVRRLGLDTRYLCLCTDDIHPNILLAEGHLDERMRLAIRSGSRSPCSNVIGGRAASAGDSWEDWGFAAGPSPAR